MASRSFILWLHGLGDSGPANEHIKNLFTSPHFINTNWSFPSAPSQPVTCNRGKKKQLQVDKPDDEAVVNAGYDGYDDYDFM